MISHGIENYRAYLGLRYQTFKASFEQFIAIEGKTIVELGTSRSYVSGGHPGCMINDEHYWKPDDPEQWDWGAGLFTLMAALHLDNYQPEIHSVDISSDAIEVSRVMTQAFQKRISYHLMSSERFLTYIQGNIDFLYMDAGETGPEAEALHLREAQIAVERDLFSEQAIVLVDDVNIPGNIYSKGKYSIPYLCEHGFEIIAESYQVLLQKKYIP